MGNDGDHIAAPPVPTETAGQQLAHFARFAVLWVGVAFAMYLAGLGLLFFVRILRSTGGRGRDAFLLLVPLLGPYMLIRHCWRYVARSDEDWLPRTDLVDHRWFGPNARGFDIVPRSWIFQPEPV